MSPSRILGALAVATALALPAARAADTPIPLRLTHHGRLLDHEDMPVNARVKLTITINTYSGVDPAAPNEVLWTGVFENVNAAQGLYAVTLGDAPSPSLPASVFDGEVRWLGVKVGEGEELKPRLRFDAVPYAMHAGAANLAKNALALGGKTLADLDARYAPASGAQYLQLQGSGAAAQEGSAAVTGTISAAAFKGDGAELTNLPAGQITGVVSASRLPAAAAEAPGIVSTDAQTFGGAKTFEQLHTTAHAVVGTYLQIGTTELGCGSELVGAMRYNAASGQIEFCNGAAWALFSPNFATSFASTPCNGTTEGTMRYDKATKRTQVCNGNDWTNITIDFTPDVFTFPDQTGANLGTQVSSPAVTITGIDPGAPVSVTGTNAQIRINNGSWVTSGTINPGNTLEVRTTSSSAGNQAVTAIVTVGNYSTTWTVTTASALFTFTNHTFTSCGVTGQNGPTLAQCKTTYAGATTWVNNTTFFQVNNGVQVWTVPQTGTYRIEAWGARGGTYTGNGLYGVGARMRGDFALTAGEQLRLLVGQAGTDYSSQAGGGGGTFVVRQNGNTPLLIAGGGGGGYSTCSGNIRHGTQASTGRTCSPPVDNGGYMYNAAATNGGGGPGYDAGGGGGFSGNGESTRSVPVYSVFTGGYSFINGGSGGNHNGGGSFGGFGGGGGSHSGLNAGGGGGGYSGGGGGYSGENCGAGGGSYNSGINQSNSDGENVSNPPLHGQVTITRQ